MARTDVPNVLTVTEAAELLGLSRSAAYRAAQRGDFPTLRFGSRVLVPTAPLLALLGLADDTPWRQGTPWPQATS